MNHVITESGSAGSASSSLCYADITKVATLRRQPQGAHVTDRMAPIEVKCTRESFSHSMIYMIHIHLWNPIRFTIYFANLVRWKIRYTQVSMMYVCITFQYM